MQLILDLFKVFALFLPRLIITGDDVCGVVESFGRYKRTFYGGMLFLLPFQQAHTMSSEVCVGDLPTQSIVTRDGKVIGVSGSVTYVVKEPRLALLETNDLEEMVVSQVQDRVAEFISMSESSEVRIPVLKEYVMDDNFCRRFRSNHGTTIKDLYIHELSPQRVIRLMSDGHIKNG